MPLPRPLPLPAACVLASALAGALTCCKRADPPPPLPSELASVQCPAGKTGHAVTSYGAARLTWLCIEPQLVAQPQMLACDRDAIPPVCDGSGMFLLRRDAQDVVHTDSKDWSRDTSPPERGPTNDSELLVYFHKAGQQRATFDPVDTPYRFMMADARSSLPAGFTFVKGAQCDRAATVLNTGTCNIEARTPSLYWHITISVRHKKGTPIFASEYGRELDFWMKYLGEMVVDPQA